MPKKSKSEMCLRRDRPHPFRFAMNRRKFHPSGTPPETMIFSIPFDERMRFYGNKTPKI